MPAAVGAPAAEPRVASRRRVGLYIALAIAALIPLVTMRLSGTTEGAHPLAWPRFARLMDDIRFGSGLRFWAGVTGAGVMALLLLYPLRKVLAHRFRLGSVGGWLHLHIVLGLAGPVLILYHCNLGTGGFNANVALTTMLIVTVSGILGHLVHAPASAAFHAARGEAAAARLRVVNALDRIDGMSLSKTTLITELEASEAELLAPRPGIIATLRGRSGVGGLADERLTDARWLIEQTDAPSHAGEDVLRTLEQYCRILRRAVTRSLADQVLARWRLFHMPLFLVMIAATTLHVVAVWDVDGLRAAVVEPADAPPAAVAAAVPAARPGARAAAAGAAPEPRIVVPPVRIVRVTEAPAVPAVAAPKAAAPAAAPAPPVPVAKPQPPRPAQKAETPPARPAPPAPSPPPAAKPAPSVPQQPAPAAAKSAGAETPLNELRRLTEPPMGLGGAKGATLAERIAELKAQRFDHAKTRFALTGRHVRVACESCHTKALEGTPRNCIACHREDDIHRGRRPDCARCHTTNRWSEIVRRR